VYFFFVYIRTYLCLCQLFGEQEIEVCVALQSAQAPSMYTVQVENI
jgi:hypothetical protein